TLSRRVAVVVAIADGGDRSPEVVVVLGVQYSNDRIGDPNRDQRHEPRTVDDTHLLRDHQLPDKRMIGHRWTDQPEPGRLGLLDRSLGAVLSAIILEFVVVGCPLLALQRNRRLWPELGSLRHYERFHVRP